MAAAAPAWAEEGGVSAPAALVPGERLSDWLLRQPSTSFKTGTVWASPAERAAQQTLKEAVLAELQRHEQRSTHGSETHRLAQWLDSLTVTGRVAIAIAEPRWLQAHPSQDPVLRTGDAVRAGSRPTTVSVVLSDGQICQVPHGPELTAASYLQACRRDVLADTDWAWIAQPDGPSSRVGLAAWNRAAEDALAPGAWIWAPPRSDGYSDALSQALIRFLATQGPAADRLPGASTAGSVPTAIAQARGPVITASDWGEIGLLQTPTARMSPAGETRFQFSHVLPYDRGTVMFQPLSWLEAGFRYTSIGNRNYTGFQQAYKDKSIDVKLRLAQESSTMPQVALGVRDLGGNGFFSGEYLVANKRFGDFDWSAGLGWGYLGSRGNIRNPFTLFGRAFERRPVIDPNMDINGGSANSKSYFRGPMALFGGLQWRTPWDPLTLKVEYEGNDYRSEPLLNTQRQRSPVNVGMVYRYAPGIDFSAGIERGDRLMLGFTLSTALDQLQMPKVADPPLPRFTPQMAATPATREQTIADIEAQTGWNVSRIEQRGNELWVDFSDAPGVYRRDRIERTIAVLHRDAPDTAQRFVLNLAERGIGRQSHMVDRMRWIALQSEAATPSSPAAVRMLDSPVSAQSEGLRTEARASARRFGIDVFPHLAPIIGGPDGFLLYRIDLLARGEWRLGDSDWLSGIASLRVLDNYSRFKYTAKSGLPRVRTLQREYATASRLTLPNLQLTHVGQLADNNFYSLYGGLLESMYAGAGAEWLYRPQRSPLAFGVDVNRVRQREFEQKFGLRDYAVSTGHATLYWNTGWNGIQTNLSVGRYLAADRGATLDISRRFDNGAAIGAYATKTNVSSAQFGEGSFDKGIYVSIPFDAVLPRSSTSVGTLVWAPLTRDGGARLARYQRLIDLTTLRDADAFKLQPPGFPAPRTGAPVFETPAELKH